MSSLIRRCSTDLLPFRFCVGFRFGSARSRRRRIGETFGFESRQDTVEPRRDPPVRTIEEVHRCRHDEHLITVASISTLTPRPRASIFTTTLSLATKAKKTLAIITAAALITRAVAVPRTSQP